MVGVRTFATHPLVLAAILTLVNASKPVLIDDTAYLTFARHLAKCPFEPYGFELFWYDRPQPAMEIVQPPVLPYWLALGIAAFGENLLLLKLWLFPFACALAFSVRSLVRRFVSRDGEWIAVLLTIGPGTLPFFNFMLDLPALALQLAAVALAIRGIESPKKWRFGLAAGLAIAIALHTKYSALGLPIAIMFVGYLRGAIRFTLSVVGIGLIGFSAWEAFVFAVHGQSHFLFHTFGYAKATEFSSKLALAVGLFGHLGLTAGWAGLAVLPIRARWFVIALLGSFFLTFAFVNFPGASSVAGATCITLGGLTLFVASRFAMRSKWDWETKFLAGWLLIEVLVYLAVAPFPAGRRILGVSLLVVLLIARHRSIPKAAMVFGLVAGMLVTALDAWDADAERQLPERSAHYARERGWTGTGHFVGHWGFQYYAERDGMKIVDPSRTAFEPGDWILLPDGERPQTGGYRVIPDLQSIEWEAELIIDDAIEIRTIANLYAGRSPFLAKNGERLKANLYRIVSPSKPLVVRTK